MPRDLQSARRKRKILALVAREPMSGAEIAAGVFMSVRGAWRYIKDLRDEGKVHISGYRENPKGGRCPLYLKGTRADAPIIRKRASKRHLIHDYNEARVIDLLRDAQRTARQIAPLLPMVLHRTRLLLARMRGDGIYIADYAKRGNQYYPIYAAGYRPDVDRATVVNAVRQRHREAAKEAAPWFAALTAPMPTYSLGV